MSKSTRGFVSSVTRERPNFSPSDEWKALFEPTGKGIETCFSTEYHNNI